MSGEPMSAPTPEAGGRATSVGGRRAPVWRPWVVAVLVGVPLLDALAALLIAAGRNGTATALGASVLAALVAGRVSGIHGVGRWFAAWVLILVLASLVGLLILPWDMPG